MISTVFMYTYSSATTYTKALYEVRFLERSCCTYNEEEGQQNIVKKESKVVMQTGERLARWMLRIPTNTGNNYNKGRANTSDLGLFLTHMPLTDWIET